MLHIRSRNSPLYEKYFSIVRSPGAHDESLPKAPPKVLGQLGPTGQRHDVLDRGVIYNDGQTTYNKRSEFTWLPRVGVLGCTLWLDS